MKTTTTKTPHISNQSTLSAFAAALLGATLLSGTAHAVDYTWDPTSGDSQITEGTGNWDTTTTNWTTDGGTTNVVAPSSAFGSDLIFGGGAAGTAGTITLTETGNSFGSLEFFAPNAGNYDLDLNGNIVNIRRSAQTFRALADATISDSAGGGELRHDTSQYRDANSGSTLSISAVVADRGTAVVRTYDSITLDLSGVNTYTGGTELYNSSTLRISGAGQLGSGTYAGTIAMNQSSVLDYASSADQTLSGVISGTGSLEMNGSGTLTISAKSTYTGATQINSGTLRILADAGGNGLTSDYFINNGSTLVLDETTASNLVITSDDEFTFDSNGGGTLTLNGNTIWRDATIATTGGERNTVNGNNFNLQNTYAVIFDVADGTDANGIDLEVSTRVERGSIIKNGDGTLLLTNNANRPLSSNSITINGGTLEVGSSGQIDTSGGANGDWSGPLAINNDGIFKHSSDQTQALSGTVSGTGSIEKIDGAALTLSGNSTYTGATTIGDGVNGSVIRAGSATGLSDDSAFTVNANGTLILDGNDSTIGSLAGAGAVRNDSLTTAATLSTGGDNSSTTFSGTLTDGASALALSLTKEGAGTMTITGTQQHTGTTTVSGGTLSMATGSGHSGSGDYVVQGGILEIATGVSLSNHAMTIGLGGVISPGNSPGTASTGAQTWNDGGSYLWEINDSGGTQGTDPGWDWLDITGALDLTNLTAGGFTIDIDSLTAGNIAGDAVGFDTWTKGSPGDFDYSFTIATASSGISGFDAADFVLDSSGFSNAPGWDWGIVLSGNSLVLQAYALPEPSSSALLGLGGLALMLRRKRS